ncbi:MAG: shikimate dehydrogenase [Thainema sp.]
MKQPLISGKTKLLGIIGSPVTHSMSPAMQNAAIAHLELDYIYVPFPVLPDQLEDAIVGFTAIGVQGFNITIPHKQAIIPYLTEISDEAKAVGAVNTAWRTEQGWSGTNTDVIGFLAPLRSLDWDWRTVTPIVLGNGGAARAVVAGFAKLGCSKLHLVGRSAEKLDQFVASWQSSPLQIELVTHTWDALDELVAIASLIVNTTPIGMHPNTQASPLSDEQMQRVPSSAIAYDLIYTPSPTQFLRQAAAQGSQVIDGTEMLIHQGAAALEQWVGQPAPIDVMRQALHQQLHAH